MGGNRLLYLSYADVASLGVTIPSLRSRTLADVIDALEIAFREKGQGKAEMPPKPGVHPIPAVEDLPGGGDNLHAMPSYIPALQAAGVKWVSG